MPNLFPNMEVQQYKGSEDFIFAAPISPVVWDKFRKGSRLTSNLKCDVRLYRLEDSWSGKNITLLLREPHHTDDALLEAGAWLRMIEGNTDRIYCVPKWGDEGPPLPSTYYGAPGHLCAMFEIPT